MRDTIISGIGAGLATSLCGVLSWSLDGCSISRSSAPELTTKAEVSAHAGHPNQCLLAWAVGSFLVSQIMVGAVVAPLLAHFWPVVWRGTSVC